MNKKLFKGIGVALLIAAVLIATIPAGGLNAAVVDEFQMDHDSLDKYEGTAFVVSVPNDVKRIGEEAFAGNQNIAQVDTGMNTKYIEHGAFSNCPYLYSVTTHDNLEKIDTAAFAGDNKLTSVYIGGNVKDLGYGVFAGCNNLASLSISRNNEDLTVMGGGLYDDKGEMLYAYLGGYDATYYRMPSSVQHMSKYSFWGNERLDSVSLSPYLTSIPAYAFSNCRNLKQINIPYSVAFIDAKAFENCVSLVDVVIPPSVTFIDPTAFDGCSKLNIIADPGTAAYEFFRNFDNSDIANTENGDTKTVVIPNAPETTPYVGPGTDGNFATPGVNDGSGANGGGSGDNSGNGSSGVSGRGGSEGDGANQGGTGTGDGNGQGGTGDIGGNGAGDNGNNGNNGNNGDNGNNGTSTPNGDSLNYQESPLTIASAATGYRDASTDPSNVDYMPTVDPLSMIDGPDVVAKTIVVGGRAVMFLDPNVTIHQGVVANTLNTGNANAADADGGNGDVAQAVSDDNPVIYDSGKGGYLPKYTEVGNKIAMQAYYASRNMDDYEMPSYIRDIGDFAFARSNLDSVVISDGVTHIGYGAFYHCDDLSQVVIPSTVTDIEGYAFDNTPYINNFKSNVSGGDFLIVGDGILLAYGGSDSVITVPEGVKKIAPGVFMDNKKITSVSLPSTLGEVGEDAFRGCTSLSSVTGGDNVYKIGDRAYMNCPLSALTIPGSVAQMGLRSVDYSDTGKSDNTKVVVFTGSTLPVISSGKTSARLENDDYRQDALRNVLYAVVPNSIEEFNGTVLDGDNLGFSGLILSKELDGNGNETGNMIVRDNHIFSEDILASLPQAVTIQGTTYNIKDLDKVTPAQAPAYSTEASAQVRTVYNGVPIDGYMAKFTETENVGTLNIVPDSSVASQIKDLYAELFGADNTPEIAGYDITLKDVTETVPINRFGKSELTVTMPIPVGVEGNTYHVMCVDADGQLEEVSATVDDESDSISFTTDHLSHFGIYATDGDTGRSILRNGQTVKNYKLDDSPNTGDASLNVRYVIAFLVACLGLFFLIYKKKSIV